MNILLEANSPTFVKLLYFEAGGLIREFLQLWIQKGKILKKAILLLSATMKSG